MNTQCPHCGYCPTCGRSNTWRPAPYVPWRYPYYWYSGSGNVSYTDGTTSISWGSATTDTDEPDMGVAA